MTDDRYTPTPDEREEWLERRDRQRERAREPIMDFPQAWEWARNSRLEDHDPRCSWVAAKMLCDCRVLWDEYDRRAAEKENDQRKPASHTPAEDHRRRASHW